MNWDVLQYSDVISSSTGTVKNSTGSASGPTAIARRLHLDLYPGVVSCRRRDSSVFNSLNLRFDLLVTYVFQARK